MKAYPVGRVHVEALRKAEVEGFPDNIWFGKTVRRYNEGYGISMSYPEMMRLEARINGFLVRFRPSTHELVTLLLIRGPRVFTTRAEIVDMLYAWREDGGPLSAEKRISQMALEMHKNGVPFEVYNGWGLRIATTENR